jgi:hypothetical protein
MDAFNAVVQVPSWAYDFCYYYLAAAALVVVYSVYSIVTVLMLPASVKKAVPVVSMVTALLLSGIVSSVLVMMQFWICRSALRPVEKFASSCGSAADCAASAGVPQDSTCTCGERGFCGGCKSRAAWPVDGKDAPEPLGVDF